MIEERLDTELKFLFRTPLTQKVTTGANRGLSLYAKYGVQRDVTLEPLENYYDAQEFSLEVLSIAFQRLRSFMALLLR